MDRSGWICRLTAWLVVVFLCQAHLLTIQLVAWGNMYSGARDQGATGREAVQRTFDLSAPCEMCHLVEELQQGSGDPASGECHAPAPIFTPSIAVLVSSTGIRTPQRPIVRTIVHDAPSRALMHSSLIWRPPTV